jgi:hypothetical protein
MARAGKPKLKREGTPYTSFRRKGPVGLKSQGFFFLVARGREDLSARGFPLAEARFGEGIRLYPEKWASNKEARLLGAAARP